MSEAEKGDLVIVECVSRAIGLTPGANSTYSIFRCGLASKVDGNGLATRIKVANKTHEIQRTPGYKAHHIVHVSLITDMKACLAALRAADLDSLEKCREIVRPFLKG